MGEVCILVFQNIILVFKNSILLFKNTVLVFRNIILDSWTLFWFIGIYYSYPSQNSFWFSRTVFCFFRILFWLLRILFCFSSILFQFGFTLLQGSDLYVNLGLKTSDKSNLNLIFLSAKKKLWCYFTLLRRLREIWNKLWI